MTFSECPEAVYEISDTLMPVVEKFVRKGFRLSVKPAIINWLKLSRLDFPAPNTKMSTRKKNKKSRIFCQTFQIGLF